MKKIRVYISIAILILGIIIVSICLYETGNKEEAVQTGTQSSQYNILVDVEESKLYLFENGQLIDTYKCSGGKWSTPSPIGTWQIIEKAKWGEGFGGSWMGLNVPWGKFRNTWNFRTKFIRLGKFTWLYKNG